jgi:hypothetical protein
MTCLRSKLACIVVRENPDEGVILVFCYLLLKNKEIGNDHPSTVFSSELLGLNFGKGHLFHDKNHLKN